MGEFVKEIRRVLDAFDGGVNAPQNIAEFITLSQRLQLLFNHFTSFRATEEGSESEKYLFEATKHCIAYFLMHFEADVLRQQFATELQANDFDSIVHPAYQALEGLFTTASEQAKLFTDEFLKDQIHHTAMLIFGFVPTLDPPQLGRNSPVSSNAADFFPVPASANEASFDSGMSSGNSSSSSLSDEIDTPPVAQFAEDMHSSSTDKVSEAALPTSSSRSLAEGMDINDIITSGLGLSGGHRGQALQINNDSEILLRSGTASQTEEEQSPAVTRDDLGLSSAMSSTNELRDPAEKKKKRRAPRKSGSGRQRTTSSHSNPNKENLRSGV